MTQTEPAPETPETPETPAEPEAPETPEVALLNPEAPADSSENQG
jgi:hypothetical protein